MYKLVQQYESKNKIIEQIQKSLSRRIAKQHHEADTKKVAEPHPTHFHLPNVYLRSQYSARSSHKSLETKLSNLIFKQEHEAKKKVQRRHLPNWIKAINIKSKQRSLQNFLLVNERESSKSFLNPSRQLRDESLNESKQMIGKRGDFNNQSKILSQYESLKRRQSSSDSFSHNSFQIVQNTYQSEWIQQERKAKRRVAVTKKRAESNMESSSQHKSKYRGQQIEQYYAPQTLNKKHKSKFIRVCSPWQSTSQNHEEDELLQLQT